MHISHHTMRGLASALAAITIMASAGEIMSGGAVVFDQGPERQAQEKTSVVLAADNVAPRPASASVNRDPIIARKDTAATLREALPESPRLEFFALMFGMLFITVAGLLAIYLVDHRNPRHDK